VSQAGLLQMAGEKLLPHWTEVLKRCAAAFFLGGKVRGCVENRLSDFLIPRRLEGHAVHSELVTSVPDVSLR